MKDAITLDQLREAIGTEIGCSEWREVTQEMINQFADATDDHQFIHVDPERAAKETPFGGTIAHGFLTLSLLSTLAYEALPMLEGATMGINYGFDKLRFTAPVPAGSRVRMRATLVDVTPRDDGVTLRRRCVVEIEGQERPAIYAEWLTYLVE